MECKRTKLVKKLAAFVLIFAVIFSLAGCIRYEARAKVNPDGTVDFALTYAISTELGDEMSSSIQDAQKEMASQGWDLEEYKQDKYNGFIATKKKIAIEDLEDELARSGFEGITIDEVDDGIYRFEWDTKSLSSDAQSSGVTADYLTQYGGYMKFSMEFPGVPIETNGSSSDGGKTVEWDLFNTNEPLYAEFSFSGSGAVSPSSATVTVHKNKKADIEILFEEVEDVDEVELFEDLEDQGWEIDGDDDVTATIKDVALDDIAGTLEDTELGFDGFDIEEDDKIYTLEWDAPNKDFTFVLELPNKAEDNNATDEDENTLEWDLSEMDEPISAEFKIKSGSNMLLLIGIIGGSVVVVGIVILVIVLIAKKKKNKGPKDPTPVVAVPQAPQQFTPVAPQQSVPAAPQQYAPQASAAPQQYVPQAPAAPQQYVPQAPQQYVPQPPVNPTAYTSNSNLPNPGLPQIGMPPAQGTDPNNNQNQ